eukprot:TRINITY_DN25077_c0_g1_i1.p1 TRINITY_DN25077_c0_g1~~TRINITY_DN25077_c0_g1_i1.p1  ORF type:complete len:380 (+),score=144.23 TRINITY_DN25077_c0_g1_i1:62-1201(+)
MKSYLALLSCTALLTVGCDGKAAQAPLVEVNLDLPPERRWDAAVAECGGADAGKLISKYLADVTKKLPTAVVALIQALAGDLDRVGVSIPKELRVEMKALAEALDLPVGDVVMLNYIYSLRSLAGKGGSNTTGPLPDGAAWTPHACTSIVATEAASGTPYHVRNMDWNLPADERQQATFLCNFTKGNRTVFLGACYIGFVGVPSGMVPGAGGGYGVTLNERAEGGNILEDLLAATVLGGWDPTHMIRKVLVTASTYEDALGELRKLTLSAPAYFIVSGPRPQEGVVVTRNRVGVHTERALGDGALWVGQTNYDWEKEVPSYDNRRRYLKQYMDALKPAEVTPSAMFDVISSWPLRNNHSAYTTVMQPSSGTFQLFTLVP